MIANEQMLLMNAANLDPGAPGIYLLPSTQAMLEYALAVSRERSDVIVVGSLEFFRNYCPDVADGEVLTPTACFDVCDKNSSDNLTVLSFTDQLVSPEFATLLVSRAGALESSLRLSASSCGMTLTIASVWRGRWSAWTPICRTWPESSERLGGRRS